MTFSSNGAESNGGAMVIRAEDMSGTILESTFEDNSAAQGGAINVESAFSNVSFIDCDFKYVSLSRTIEND